MLKRWHFLVIMQCQRLNSQANHRIKTRGPRGPWNAHLRQKMFKVPFFHRFILTKFHKNPVTNVACRVLTRLFKDLTW